MGVIKMATNNPTFNQADRPSKEKKGFLRGLVVKGEHMIAFGCGGLLVVLLVCALSVWFAVDSWSPATDPAPTVRVRAGEVEHSSLDTCSGDKVAFQTEHGMVCR